MFPEAADEPEQEAEVMVEEARWALFTAAFLKYNKKNISQPLLLWYFTWNYSIMWMCSVTLPTQVWTKVARQSYNHGLVDAGV